MVEPKGGPVKPPILDLKPTKSTTKKPNPVPGAKSAAKTAKASSATKREIPPQNTNKNTGANKESAAENQSFTPKPSIVKPSGFAIIPVAIGAIGGALLAIIIMVPLILSGILKPLGQSEITPQIASLDQRVRITEEQITQNLVGFSVMDEQVNGLRERLGSQIDGFSTQTKLLADQQKNFEQQQALLLQNIDSISQRLNDLPASPDNGAELAAIEKSISDLNTRLNAVAAGSTSEDAAKIGADIAQIQADFLNFPEKIQSQIQNNLDLQISDIKAQIAQIASTTTILDERLAQAIATIEINEKNISDLDQVNLDKIPSAETQSGQNQTLQASLYLPLALMGMETALASGKEFDTELQSIALYLPSLQIPDLVNEMASNNRPLPSLIIENFNRAIPAMLAAKPKNPDAGWSQQLWDNMRSLLALRPVGQTEGDQTENLVSQIEAAINRSDFSAAAGLITQLPPPMILALGELNSQITALGSANNLLDQARSLTLSQLATGQDINISEPELNAQ
ncbi:MAG: hypothetical protein L3J21_01685 [Devosiaceae bacterium]|nr:hypothetical protein [Devosiaceae bacterium]